MAKDEMQTVRYCVYKPAVEKLKDDASIKIGTIRVEPAHPNYDGGSFGWINISYASGTALLSFFKALVLKEKELGVPP